MPSARREPSVSPTHYSLLAEYHQSAMAASLTLEKALRDKEDAESRIREARKKLSSAQDMVVKYYKEPPTGSVDRGPSLPDDGVSDT